MGYFLPSFMQKRLLRYALSRLELVDTDALDLDSLGITWGQRSSFELRNVGLRLQKLSAILRLPPTIGLTAAKILLLRITVPADIYTSGIVVEVEGVQGHLKILSGNAPGQVDVLDSRKPSGLARGVKANRPRSPRPGTCDPGGSERGADTEAPVLPSTTDLAESFLQSEPRQEREELEAAIASQSQSLHQSTTVTDDGENESELGTQEGVSLPSFIAGFLKGVMARLQLYVKDVVLRLELELPTDLNVKDGNKTDSTTVKLSLSSLTVNALSSSVQEDGQKGRKRKISLDDIRISLISSPNAFSSSKLSAPPSPVTSRSKTVRSTASTRSAGSSSPTLSNHLAMTRSTILEGSARDLGQSSHFTKFRSVHPGSSHHESFHDPESPGVQANSQYADSILDNPSYLDDVINSQFDDSNLDDSAVLPHDSVTSSEVFHSGVRSQYASYFSGPREHSSPPQSPSHEAPLSDPSSPTSPPSEGVDNQAHAEMLVGSQLCSNSSDTADNRSTQRPEKNTIRSSSLKGKGQNTTPAEDLASSRLFTHEDAESMYMSAVSHAPSTIAEANPMPGGWNSPESKPHRSRHAMTSPTLKQLEESRGGIETDNRSTTPTQPQSPERPSRTNPSLDVHNQPETIDREPLPGAELVPQDLSSSSSSEDLSFLSKDVLQLDNITVWVPDSDNVSATNTSKGIQSKESSRLASSQATLSDTMVLSNLPMQSFRFVGHQRRGSKTRQSEGSDPIADAIPVENAADTMEIEMGKLICRLDISIGKLASRAMYYYYTKPASKQTAKPPQNASQKQNIPPASFKIDHFSLQFVERISGTLVSSRELSSVVAPKAATELDNDILLQLNCSGIHLSTFTDTSVTKMRLDVRKASFGHATGNILAFDAGLRIRDSVRDILSPTEGDISVGFVAADTSTHVNIRTLPVRLILDLQKLDEILGWFGGLSGLLELGSSIASTSTIRGGPSKSPSSTTKPRGVHFERAVQHKPSTQQPAMLPSIKTTARIGGVTTELVGSECKLKLATTAVKIVSRAEGIGLTIDKAKLTGPHFGAEDKQGATSSKVENIRLEFLQIPTEDDLGRLLSILTPSRDKYDEDDDIMLDTLFRQRRQGAVLRLTVDHVRISVSQLNDLDYLPKLGRELAKLSTVAKYLPEDDRPGVLSLLLVKEMNGHVEVGGAVGDLRLCTESIDVAHVSIPSLIALQVGKLLVTRNTEEILVKEAISSQNPTGERLRPMIMLRYIADEMEPTVKVKLYNTQVEYTVDAIMAFTGLTNDMTGQDIAVNMANSVINLAENDSAPIFLEKAESQTSSDSDTSNSPRKPLRLAVAFRDSVVGLNPRNIPAKALVVLTDAKFAGATRGTDDLEASLELRRASVLVIDDAQWSVIADEPRRRSFNERRGDQIEKLSELGYVPVSFISSASVAVKMMQVDDDPQKSLDVELRDDLLIIESCADSTQTLISVLNSLSPPMPPSKAPKYRTEVVPLQDMLASLSGDAFLAKEGVKERDSSSLFTLEEEPSEASPELGYVSNFYQQEAEGLEEEENLTETIIGFDEMASSATATVPPSSSNPLGLSFRDDEALASSALDFHDDYFAKKSSVEGTAHRWDSAQNTYGLANEMNIRKSPMRIRIRDVHIIWNLFDGYDWEKTRDTISKAVQDVEAKALERRAKAGSRLSPNVEDEDESVIGDFLFNSIWIDIPANRDPRELANDINRNIDDVASESGSYATSTTVTESPSRRGHASAASRSKPKKLRLKRSKHHKMTFELKGISADVVVFPPDSGETQSSIDVRVKDLEIFDHVPTSTWKKFATYMHDAGVRETDTSMIHLEILNVKPIPELAASEVVLKATVLPLRLHVDQDALDFITRFFEFKDDSAVSSSSPQSGRPFLQRVEVNPIRVRLDFKPKRVDYAGLRSGRTTEFMNFFILDQADMVLRRVILYGVPGFERLGLMLNSIWMPDVKRNQLPGVLAGLAPIRGVVNVGSGIKDLVAVPIHEYKKDGRIVRSIQKGAVAFAKTTTNELVKLGAKLAIGTQTVLENAEGLLNPTSGQQSSGWEEAEMKEEEKKQISLYADQPLGVVQGLRGAYASLERDLLLARDAIVAVPGEVMESASAGGAAKAVLRKAPTVILRPAIGASKAVGQTLLGAGNTLDKDNWRRVDDKYKRH